MNLGTYIRSHMDKSFGYGTNDCVLFITNFWEPKSGKIYKVIKDRLGLDQSNWPASMDALNEVAKSKGFGGTTRMHLSLMKEIGFSRHTAKSDGDVIIDPKSGALGLRWREMGAFVAPEGVCLIQDETKHGWRL
jgi:hypothetical protein